MLELSGLDICTSYRSPLGSSQWSDGDTPDNFISFTSAPYPSNHIGHLGKKLVQIFGIHTFFYYISPNISCQQDIVSSMSYKKTRGKNCLRNLQRTKARLVLVTKSLTWSQKATWPQKSWQWSSCSYSSNWFFKLSLNLAESLNREPGHIPGHIRYLVTNVAWSHTKQPNYTPGHYRFIVSLVFHWLSVQPYRMVYSRTERIP